MYWMTTKNLGKAVIPAEQVAMPELSWQIVEERIYRLREVGVLKYYTRSEDSPSFMCTKKDLTADYSGRPSGKRW